MLSEVSVQHLPAAHLSLTLTQQVSDPPLVTPHAELLDFESRLLSEFRGRPIHIRGLIVLLGDGSLQDPSSNRAADIALDLGDISGDVGLPKDAEGEEVVRQLAALRSIVASRFTILRAGIMIAVVSMNHKMVVAKVG